MLRLATLLAACLGAIGVGFIDVVTGAEIHVVSLYFLPLVLAGWHLSRASAAGVALLSTLVWMAALYENGARHGQWLFWLVNFITQGSAFLIVALLVSRLRHQLIQEQTLRRTDGLTGLMSHSGFFEQADPVLALCRRHAHPVCLAYIDLDHFKRANDRHGHAHGDSLLRQCGTIIQRCIRASDIAGRLGGDEFVLLLPLADRHEAMVVCCRILRTLEATADFSSAGVTASIGIVVDEGALHPVAELLRRADAEMYRIKRAGLHALDGGRSDGH